MSESNDQFQSFISSLVNATNQIASAASSAIEKVGESLQEQIRSTAEGSVIDVKTVDKILNNAMNNSHIEVKLGLGEGCLNGLFCGSTVSLISIHVHEAPVPPSPSENP